MAFPVNWGNAWKERKEETNTGVHTGRPPHIIKGTGEPPPALHRTGYGRKRRAGGRSLKNGGSGLRSGKEGNRWGKLLTILIGAAFLFFLLVTAARKILLPGPEENISPYRSGESDSSAFGPAVFGRSFRTARTQRRIFLPRKRLLRMDI